MSRSILVRLMIFVLLAIVIIWYLFCKEAEKGSTCVNLEQGKMALKALGDWMIWLVTLSGAAIAGIATSIEKVIKTPLSDWEKAVGFCAVCCFGLSIVVAVFVVGFMPDVMLRLAGGNCDIYKYPLIGWRETNPYVGPTVTVVFSLFSAGVLSATAFVALRLENNVSTNQGL